MVDPTYTNSITVALGHLPCQYGAPDYTHMIKRRLGGRRVAIGDQYTWVIGGRSVIATIKDLHTQDSNQTTQLQIDRQHTQIHVEYTQAAQPTLTATHGDTTMHLMGSICSMFNDAAAFRQLGMPRVKSLLVHGVAGVGKSTIVKYVGKELGCRMLDLSVHDVLRLKDEFDHPEFLTYNPLTLAVSQAIAYPPSIVVIRNLDDLPYEHDKSATEKFMTILCNQIARLKDEIQVCIIGLACELRQVPDPMQKNDIFGEHIHIPIPTMAERINIIRDLLATMSLEQISGATENLQDYYAKQIALRTSAYVARDLKLLCRRALLKSLRRSGIAESLSRLTLNVTTRSSSEVQWEDFDYALSRQRPSQQMQVESDLPKRSWSALGGYEAVKRRIRQATLLPLLQPEVFSKLGIKAPSGLLLYGPSGCGKTAFVQALASESMLNVISIKGPEIFSKYLGETELKIRNLFATAKRIAPCIMFIDEMDAISTRRGWNSGDSSGGVNERVLSTLLNEMDGVEGRQGVIVIGCTNRPDQIDDAILRPGRLDQLVYLGLPSQEDRRAIIDVLIQKTAVGADVKADDLSEKMEYCTGADIENLFREAGTIALRKDVNAQSIDMEQVNQVIGSICDKARHRVLEEGSLDIYEQFHKDHSI